MRARAGERASVPACLRVRACLPACSRARLRVLSESECPVTPGREEAARGRGCFRLTLKQFIFLSTDASLSTGSCHHQRLSEAAGAVTSSRKAEAVFGRTVSRRVASQSRVRSELTHSLSLARARTTHAHTHTRARALHNFLFLFFLPFFSFFVK